MIIVFSSKASGDITMFGNIAQSLLRMMGHSGTAPGALLASEVPAALTRLQSKINDATPDAVQTSIEHATADNDDKPRPVGLQLRAYPLVEMLSAAIREKADVTWDVG